MKTNGPRLSVADLRLAAHRRLRLSASASKKKTARMAEKSGSNNGGKAKRTGRGRNGRGRGLGGGRGMEGWERGGGESLQTAQIHAKRRDFTRRMLAQTNPPTPPTKATLKGGGHWGED